MRTMLCVGGKTNNYRSYSLLALANLLLAGCATLSPYAQAPIAAHLERSDALGDCARLFAQADRAIDHSGARDVEAARVPGFPYLRVNRFLQALAAQAQTPERKLAWRTKLAQLDQQARSAETTNAGLPYVEKLDACRDQLLALDQREHELIAAAAQVPDDYSIGLRALGLYPLTQLAFSGGIRHWQNSTREVFSLAQESLPVRGQVQGFAPVQLATSEMSWPLPRDTLGIFKVNADTAGSLLQAHAPVLEIDVVAEYDKPGTVVLDANGLAQVDTRLATAYGRIAHTLFEGKPHLQLVYTYWFSERPSASSADLLAGRLDALIWRVTLDDDGAALLYDSIHSCGCYHHFFPTQRLRVRPQSESLEEALLVPQTLLSPKPDERSLLRLASGTHYLQRVKFTSALNNSAVGYRLEDEHRLRQLRLPTSHLTRSIYGPDGLVAGSERGERFFFWPMGIASAGQMRQWGHHATAFVGRRHFDDAHLLERYFERAP